MAGSAEVVFNLCNSPLSSGLPARTKPYRTSSNFMNGMHLVRSVHFIEVQ